MITHVTLDFQRKNPHAECKASSNYGKVVKALALLLGICAWYPSERQQAVGNLRPPLPLGLKPVRCAGLTNCLRNGGVSSNYSWNHSWEQQNGRKLLNRGGFDNRPHSVHHQPGRARNLLRRSLGVTTCDVSQHKKYQYLHWVIYIRQVLVR